jgi:hypothetical protein
MGKKFGNSIVFVTAVLGIAIVAIGQYFVQEFQCKDRVVTMASPKVSLPYKTEDSRSFSADSIPRGQFWLSPSRDITQVELSAVLLDPQKNLIKQVLLIGGNFSNDAEFELSDRFNSKIVVPAKVIDRITLQPFVAGSHSIYLFASPIPRRWRVPRVVAVELDNQILLSRLLIRQAGAEPGDWVQSKFVSTNEPIDPRFTHRNDTPEVEVFKHIYPAASCRKEV